MRHCFIYCWEWNQGFMQAGQALFPLSHSPGTRFYSDGAKALQAATERASWGRGRCGWALGCLGAVQSVPAAPKGRSQKAGECETLLITGPHGNMRYETQVSPLLRHSPPVNLGDLFSPQFIKYFSATA